MAAYRVLGVTAPTATPRKVGGRSAMMVGREAELAVLHQAIDRLKAGSGSVAVVIGDAGIGKSRLVEEAFKGLRRKPSICFGDAASPTATRFPDHLWLELLRGTARIPADAPNEIVDARLRAWINQYCPDDCEEIYQALARLLALTRRPRGSSGAAPSTASTSNRGCSARSRPWSEPAQPRSRWRLSARIYSGLIRRRSNCWSTWPG